MKQESNTLPSNEIELSIILPCRNEEKSLGFCIKKIQKVISEAKIKAEIIVSDSSTDSSPDIARKNNVILLKHDKEGYGTAYREAFAIARGKYIFMADADNTYDFSEIPRFLKHLRAGNDFVIGNRMAGEMEDKAMPWHHRYIGNPFFAFIFRIFTNKNIHDPHCGMRAVSRKTLNSLGLKTGGMEFASEMIIKATRNELSIIETPINYYKRSGISKLRSFPDGWRHLRFILLYHPILLFFLPGLLFFSIGCLSLLFLYFDWFIIFGRHFYTHPMFFFSALIIIGYQLIIFSLFAKSYAINHLDEKDPTMARFYKYITIERAGSAGIIIGAIGLIIYGYIIYNWLSAGLGEINQEKNAIIGLTFLVLGIQTIFSAFMLSILGIKK